jgi:ATP-dependent Clp protease ATP-binding subunit ClpC
MIRLDMSEYMEKHSVSRLIGAPPGYVGHDEGGELCKQVRRRPYSLILLDELEKAHRDVCSILLQIMEDGILTDSHGRVAQFKNAILILTSNVGAEEMGKAYPLGFADIALSKEDEGRAAKEKAMEALRRRFRPELLNRIDEIVVFGKLTRADLSRIAELLLQKTADRLKGEGITLSYTETLRERLVDIGYSPLYGARALRRVVTKEIEDRISAVLLKREALCGSRIHFDYGDGEIRITVESENKAVTAGR